MPVLHDAKLCELTVSLLSEEDIDGAGGCDSPVREGCGSRV